ncbi:MAG: hypothetical protein QNJ46_21655 [Leptolyngbyaceae cyanobacterium MO_188.B28]|nr:hypothetical protein [Leptolyngbyaceae cyanobacterium MO_188.B28]
MVWIYLIVQTIELGVTAWSFKVGDKNEYAAVFGMGGLFSLFLVVAAVPLLVKLLTGFLMVLFHSTMIL